MCGGFANGCSIASICIARILIQIKLLTRLLPLGMTSCLNIPPSNWWWCCCSFVLLLFRFARLPPKQINEQNNRTNTVQKYSRLKTTYTHTVFYWMILSECMFCVDFVLILCFISFPWIDIQPVEMVGAHRHSYSFPLLGWLSNAPSLFTSAKWFKLTWNKTVDNIQTSKYIYISVPFFSCSPSSVRWKLSKSNVYCIQNEKVLEYIYSRSTRVNFVWQKPRSI